MYCVCCSVARLLDMVRESFGADAARNVMAVEPDNLPIILIVFKSKGKVEVHNFIRGLPLRVSVNLPVHISLFFSVVQV